MWVYGYQDTKVDFPTHSSDSLVEATQRCPWAGDGVLGSPHWPQWHLPAMRLQGTKEKRPLHPAMRCAVRSL